MIKKIIYGSLISFIVLIGSVAVWAYVYYLADNPELDAQIRAELGDDLFDFSELLDAEFGLADDAERDETAASLHRPDQEETNGIEEGAGGSSDSADSHALDAHSTESRSSDSDQSTTDEAQHTEQRDGRHSQASGHDSGASPDNDDAQRESRSLSEERIVAHYMDRFERLEDAAVDRLYSLAESALAEYEDGDLTRRELSQKYTRAARMLESSIDDIFYALLDEMEHLLDEHGHSLQSVAQAEDEYDQTKSAMQRELLRTASDF